MSPDARLIAMAILCQGQTIREDAPEDEFVARIRDLADAVRILETGLGDSAKDAPGIRGMVPVAYLKDVIEGAIARLEAIEGLPAEMVGQSLVDSPLAYLKRRLADVEGL